MQFPAGGDMAQQRSARGNNAAFQNVAREDGRPFMPLSKQSGHLFSSKSSCLISRAVRLFSTPVVSLMQMNLNDTSGRQSTQCCGLTIRSSSNDLLVLTSSGDKTEPVPMLTSAKQSQMSETAVDIDLKENIHARKPNESRQLSTDSPVSEVKTYRQQVCVNPCNHKASSILKPSSTIGSWKCWNCNASGFGSCTAWRRHIEQRDPEHIFVCPACSLVKHRKDSLRNHLMAQHHITANDAKQLLAHCLVRNEPSQERECGYCGKILDTWREFYLEHIQGHFQGRIPYKSPTWKVPFNEEDAQAIKSPWVIARCASDYDQEESQMKNALSDDSSMTSSENDEHTHFPQSIASHDTTLPLTQQWRSNSDCWQRDFQQMRIASIKSEQPRQPQLNSSDSNLDGEAKDKREMNSRATVACTSVRVSGQKPKAGSAVPNPFMPDARLKETKATFHCPFLAQEPCYREVFMHGEIFYHSEKKIGCSKKSVVDLVREHATNQVYARKTLRATGDSLLMQKQWQRELAIMRKLTDHGAPHTTRLKSYSTQENNYSLVMWPVAECSLRQYLEQPGDLYRINLTKWVGCLAEAIQFLHSPRINIRHGDIKPANILIRGSNVYLADFGESRMIHPGEEQSHNRDRFTVMYSAPEVLENRVCGKPTDVWSLGCVFVEMFTLICGRSYQNYHRMLNTCSKVCQNHPAHQVRLQAILAWIRDLSSFCNDDSQEYSQQRLILATETISRMLIVSPKDRITADLVYKMFPHTPTCGNGSTMSLPERGQSRFSQPVESQVQNKDTIGHNDQARASQSPTHTTIRPLQRPRFLAHGANTALKLDLSKAEVSTSKKQPRACTPNNSPHDRASGTVSREHAVESKMKEPAARNLEVPGQEGSGTPRGFKRGRSPSVHSSKSSSSPQPGNAAESCNFRFAFRDDERQDRSSQRPSKRIIVQVSKETGETLLRMLENPGLSSLCLLPSHDMMNML